MSLSDKLIILQTSLRKEAYLVTDVKGILEVQCKDILLNEETGTGNDLIKGIIRQDDGILMILSLTGGLSLLEDQQLHELLTGNPGKEFSE